MIDNTVTSTPMAQRPKIAVDVSPELRQQMKVIAVSSGISLREFILNCIAEQHPELKTAVAAELKKG